MILLLLLLIIMMIINILLIVIAMAHRPAHHVGDQRPPVPQGRQDILIITMIIINILPIVIAINAPRCPRAVRTTPRPGIPESV